jgi:hypothetical protein
MELPLKKPLHRSTLPWQAIPSFPCIKISMMHGLVDFFLVHGDFNGTWFDLMANIIAFIILQKNIIAFIKSDIYFKSNFRNKWFLGKMLCLNLFIKEIDKQFKTIITNSYSPSIISHNCLVPVISHKWVSFLILCKRTKGGPCLLWKRKTLTLQSFQTS